MNICGQKPNVKTSHAKLVNKCISQVGKPLRYYFIQMNQCTVAGSLVSFVLHTVCLYTCWVGHLPQRIRMLTSLHSAHSFWNDSIFLILFSFRVCGFEAIWHPFSIVHPLRTFAYLNFVLKFRTGSVLRPKLRSNAESTWRHCICLIGGDSHLLFSPLPLTLVSEKCWNPLLMLRG